MISSLKTVKMLFDSILQDEQFSAMSLVPGLNDRILTNNTELSAFVSLLSQEKIELRRTLAKLESEIWNYRRIDHSSTQVGDPTYGISLGLLMSVVVTNTKLTGVLYIGSSC